MELNNKMILKVAIFVILYMFLPKVKSIYNQNDIETEKTSRLRRQAIIPNKEKRFWTLPIKYNLDRSYKKKSRDAISEAIKHIEERSCIRFQQEKILVGKSIRILNQIGCITQVGENVNPDPQVLYLSQAVCYPLFGAALKLIVNALGFYNEQNRIDSPNFVTINVTNIWPDTARIRQLFLPFNNSSEIQNFGVPYDYGSILHFSGDAFSAYLNPTIIANDPLFQDSMGQRTGLSFYDVKLLNRAYCEGKCQSFKHPCKRGGIRNPNRCMECICPDGYGGNLCETVGKSDSKCFPNEQTIISVTSKEKCLQSPNYGSGSYDVNSKCNWILKAPTRQKIRMRFTGQFAIFKNLYSCSHWIEVKFRKNLEIGGPRFCGKERPKSVLVSEGNEAVISFRSNFNTDASNRKGFRLCYKLNKEKKPKDQACIVIWRNGIWPGICKKQRKCRFPCGRQSCKSGEICCFKKGKMPPKDRC